MQDAETLAARLPAARRLAAAAWARVRWLSFAVSHAPHLLRALVRADELWLTLLASLIGVITGLLVVGMNQTSQRAHELLYALPRGQHLSAQPRIALWQALIPAAGGLLLAGVTVTLTRLRPRRAIDPIEANALYGGKMSFWDSLVVVAQTMVSNGFGASVGLEAAFAQIGGAVASRAGRAFRLRRGDMRVLVGAGTAGAIAAAFNAPLTGAFYAFELVIGTYTLATLAPVVAASIAAVTIQRVLLGDSPGFDVPPLVANETTLLPLLVLGVIAALCGVLVMRGVTFVEALYRRLPIPAWLRPATGGLVVGCLALATPTVLASGHGALREGLTADLALPSLVMVLTLKAAASAVSLGSGFRGGLFFASLLMGALLGKIFAVVMLMISPVPIFPEVIYGLVGMSAFAVAIVGGPLTMAFLALESTGSLPLTAAVLCAAVVSSLTVRRSFGYSFATWRFHLRGESIRSAVDIGWMRSLTVGRMMRRDVRTVLSSMPLPALRAEFPLGSTNRVVCVDEAGRYAGIIWLADAYAAGRDAARVGDILHCQQTALLPEMTVKQAIDRFEAAEADALAVVDATETMRVTGLLTEQHALRRYAEELDRRRRELSGE